MASHDVIDDSGGGRAAASAKPFQIRGRYFTAVALRPEDARLDDAFYAALDAQLGQTPQFFARNRGFQAGDEWSIPVLHLFGGTPGAKSATIKVGEKVKLSSGREAWKLSISLDGETWACWFGTGPGAPLLRSQRVFSSDPALARYRLRYKSSDPALR